MPPTKLWNASSRAPPEPPSFAEMTMNETIEKFGYPATLVADYHYWVVLLRPAQPTLGSLVLAAKSDATAFSALPPPAFVELARVVSDIESALRDAVSFARINYMMLMMVDPNDPRYEGERSAAGLTIADTGWPKLPVLGDAVELDAGQIETAVDWLKGYWPKS
jgi:hypothetical protein